MQIQMEVYYKEWAHLSMEAGMSQDLQGVSASGVPGELRVQFKGRNNYLTHPFWAIQDNLLDKGPSTLERAICFPQSTDLLVNINLI